MAYDIFFLCAKKIYKLKRSTSNTDNEIKLQTSRVPDESDIGCTKLSSFVTSLSTLKFASTMSRSDLRYGKKTNSISQLSSSSGAAPPLDPVATV